MKHDPVIEALAAFPVVNASLDGNDVDHRSAARRHGSRHARPHAGLGGGMTASVGRLRACAVLNYRFVALVHNTVRGAAGAAILNAELLVSRGLVPRRGDIRRWEVKVRRRTTRRRRG